MKVPYSGTQAHLEAHKCSTGLRAASAQGTGLMWQLPKKKGGGRPQIGCGKGLMGGGVARDLYGKAALQPRWAQSGPKKRGQATPARAGPEGRGRETGEGRGLQRWRCPKRDTFENCSSVFSKGQAVPKRGPMGGGWVFAQGGMSPRDY